MTPGRSPGNVAGDHGSFGTGGRGEAAFAFGPGGRGDGGAGYYGGGGGGAGNLRNDTLAAAGGGGGAGSSFVDLLATDKRMTPDASGIPSVTISPALSALPPAALIVGARVTPSPVCATCGARLRFTLRAAAVLTLEVRRVHSSKVLRVRTLRGKPGPNSYAFSARGLKPGRYVLTLRKHGSRRGGVTVNFRVAVI